MASDNGMPETRMTIARDDLSEDEHTVLKRVNRGPYSAVSESMAQRLIALGLAQERPRGIAISRAGRELVTNMLLGLRDE